MRQLMWTYRGWAVLAAFAVACLGCGDDDSDETVDSAVASEADAASDAGDADGAATVAATSGEFLALIYNVAGLPEEGFRCEVSDTVANGFGQGVLLHECSAELGCYEYQQQHEWQRNGELHYCDTALGGTTEALMSSAHVYDSTLSGSL